MKQFYLQRSDTFIGKIWIFPEGKKKGLSIKLRSSGAWIEQEYSGCHFRHVQCSNSGSIWMENIQKFLQPQMQRMIQASCFLLQFMMTGGRSTSSGKVIVDRDIQVKGWFKPSTHIKEGSSLVWHILFLPSLISISHHLALPCGNLLCGGKEEQV